MARTRKHTIPTKAKFPKTSAGKPDLYKVLGGANANPIPWAELAATLGMSHEAVGKLYYRQEVQDPATHIKTVKAVQDARKAGMRWDRLAARSGLTVAMVKAVTGTVKPTEKQAVTIKALAGKTPIAR